MAEKQALERDRIVLLQNKPKFWGNKHDIAQFHITKKTVVFSTPYSVEYNKFCKKINTCHYLPMLKNALADGFWCVARRALHSDKHCS